MTVGLGVGFGCSGFTSFLGCGAGAGLGCGAGLGSSFFSFFSSIFGLFRLSRSIRSTTFILFSNLISSFTEIKSGSFFSSGALFMLSMVTVSFFWRLVFRSTRFASFFASLSLEYSFATKLYCSSLNLAFGSFEILIPLSCRNSTIVESPTLNSLATLLNLTVILRFYFTSIKRAED